MRVQYENQFGHKREYETSFEGVIPNLMRRYKETDSDYIRMNIEQYMTARPCPTCKGRRLNPIALAVTVADKAAIEESVAAVLVARLEARLDQSAAGVIVSNRVVLANSAVLLAVSDTIEGNVRVQVKPPVAAVFGAALGAALGVALLVGRRRG